MPPQTRVVQSLQGVVELSRTGSGSGVARVPNGLVAVACGGAFDPLAKLSWPVLSMQLRGYGKSRAAEGAGARDAGAFRMTNYMADFDAAFDSAKWKKGALLGYSHSGFFAAAYALARPERVSALILVEPAIGTADREELLQRARLVQEGRAEESISRLFARVEPEVGLQDTAVKKAASAILNNVNEDRALVGELMARADHPISAADLTKLSMPVLLIGGTRSPISRTVRELASEIPFASVFWVRGARHSELMDGKYAPQIGGAVEGFLAGVGKGES